MDFVFFLKHVLVVLDSLETKFNKDVAVKQFFSLYFVQFLLDFAYIFFEDFVDKEVNSVLVDSEIRCEFKLRHLFNLQPPHDSDDLEQAFFASFHWLFDAQLFGGDPALYVDFDLMHKHLE